jgi:hypothetical protein
MSICLVMHFISIICHHLVKRKNKHPDCSFSFGFCVYFFLSLLKTNIFFDFFSCSVSLEFQHNVCGRSIYAEGTIDAVLFLAEKVKFFTCFTLNLAVSAPHKAIWKRPYCQFVSCSDLIQRFETHCCSTHNYYDLLIYFIVLLWYFLYLKINVYWE